MNDPISWDPSLVKKFSTSNHYKLLNQLRNEVKKYPLNNRKKISSTSNNDVNQNKNNKSNEYHLQNNPSSSKENQINEPNNNNVTISFNNAKDFSIYSKTNSNSNPLNETIVSEHSNLTDDNHTKTFKDRLNQIDMK